MRRVFDLNVTNEIKSGGVVVVTRASLTTENRFCLLTQKMESAHLTLSFMAFHSPNRCRLFAPVHARMWIRAKWASLNGIYKSRKA